MKITKKKLKEKRLNKELDWFVHKYLWKKDNFELFLKKLSPCDITKILKYWLNNGMEINWNEEKESIHMRAGIMETENEYCSSCDKHKTDCSCEESMGNI